MRPLQITFMLFCSFLTVAGTDLQPQNYTGTFKLETGDVTLLTDLFHMNIEEASIGDALRENAEYVGHVHFADSNRRPVGLGHTDMTDIVAALKEIGYTGYASAEAFPYPDPDEAAAQTLSAFNDCFKSE